ncbi:MAG TPA: CHASE3 domain-containing protein, partial [Polyangia bacterium]|nr:CHASE3 domain-containing protein [Polyangia bacterium]
MMRDWTFGKKLAFGFAVSALTLIIVAVGGYQNIHRLIETNAEVTHTQRVRRELSDLLSMLKDAETGQRGYVITGADSFLEPYHAAVEHIDASFEGIRQLVADDPEQQRRLDALRPVIDAKLNELKATVELRRASGFEATAKMVQAGEGKRAMDQIRRGVGEMDRVESDLLDRRRQNTEQSAQVAKAVILWGSVLGLALVLVIAWFITRSLSQQIGSTVRHMQSSSAELQSASSQQASGSKQQATAMNEITTTISELLATSRQIAESAERVVQIAEQTGGAARAGDATVDRGQDAINGIRRQVDLIVNHMLELGKKSQQVGAVLEIVSELAEQTNILAINATIEAAGAGEAGRRFAVVADEIRKLADRVGGSTKEIRGLIEEIRAAVNTTVMATESGSKAVDAGTQKFAEVTTAFQQITDLVGT